MTIIFNMLPSEPVNFTPICVVKEESTIKDLNNTALAQLTHKKETVSILRQQSSEISYINELWKQREPYIAKRNEIIDNPFRYFFQKAKLREIDAELDKIDVKIYAYETSNMPTDKELNEIVTNAEMKVKKYLESKV